MQEKIIMQKTNITKTNIDSGMSRIEQIKSAISSFKPKTCKAEVYDTWDNLFEHEDQ
jgi:hypothetical protein